MALMRSSRTTQKPERERLMMDKITWLIVLVILLLTNCGLSLAESSAYYQMKANVTKDTGAVNFGLFHWRFAGINDHAQLTYINSSQLGNMAGVDIGGGLWFFDLGAVVGVNGGNSKAPDTHITLAIYPEIFIPIWGKSQSPDDYFLDVNARYYFTTDGRSLATFGLGFTWSN